jgi:hypothetical protein
LRDRKGRAYHKPLRSSLKDNEAKNWISYSPFATANELKTVALATKQRFSKKAVDDLIKGSL